MDKKQIIKNLLEKRIKELQDDWAQNWVAKAYQSEIDTPDAKKQVEAATFNMEESEKKLAWFQDTLTKLDTVDLSFGQS